MSRLFIWCWVLVLFFPFHVQAEVKVSTIDFYGKTINLPIAQDMRVDAVNYLSAEEIQSFYNKLDASDYKPVIDALLAYKQDSKPDDWLYYQLVRKAAQAISPKADNYYRYTLYKWFFLAKSGYDVRLYTSGDIMLFYVQSDENIYDIPYRMVNGKQYVCLNYHDYGSIDFETTRFSEVPVYIPQANQSFSYKLTQMPDFTESDYEEKDIQFSYNERVYRFKLKLNPKVKAIFANYPVTDYQSYFNTPLSRETYASLMPTLKENVKGLNVKNGVDYLMHFTRYAFLYQPDAQSFGKEKRLSPEQTLLYEHSDCEDRAALFFYLVKEIYNLPMIVLAYPQHVTIAVKFDKPVGKAIMYNGERYSVCEPTPQKTDLRVGQLPPDLSKEAYEVAYVYQP